MSEKEKLTRRDFLGKAALASAAMATVAGPAKEARAQLNNGVKPLPSKLNVGFIGVGIRGTILYNSSLPVDGVKPVMVCDLYDGHLDAAKENLGSGIAVTRDYTEVLARDDIDAVVLAVPDHWHKKIYLDSLAAGKHVYTEKPMTHKWEDGKDFIDAEKKSGLVVQVGSQFPSMSARDKAREIISSGRLGQITLVEGSIHRNSSAGAWYYPIPPDAGPETIDWKQFIGDAAWHDFDLRRFFQWRLFWEYSGGLPTDLYVHLVGAVHDLMGIKGTASKVVSFGDIYNWDKQGGGYREVPDQIDAMAFYEKEGFNFKLTASANNGHSPNLITFYGTEGTLIYEGGSLKYFYEPKDEGFNYGTSGWTKANKDKFRRIMDLDDNLEPIKKPARAEAPFEYLGQGEGATTAHLRNFYDAVRGETERIQGAEFGHNACMVGHMTNISYKSGNIVRYDAKKMTVTS
jgi:predicted dehydrogenase